MGASEHIFDEGDIIFREGERSLAAFVLVSGHVELIKNTTNGPIRLALISPGEIFGEMGIIDRSARSATARAVGRVRVEEIDRGGFINSVQDEPDMALKIIGNLSERLRQTNEMFTSSASQRVLADVQQKPSIWTLIGELIAKRRTKRRLLEFRVAPFVGDPEGVYSVQIAHILDLEPEIRATLLPELLPDHAAAGEGRHVSALVNAGRHILRRENADLIVHGEVDESQMVLNIRFIAHGSKLDQPGNFLITDRLTLPFNLKPEVAKLLIAAAVAATVPRSESYRLMMRPILFNVYEALQDFAIEPPLELTLVDQAAIQIIHGNIIATIGNHLGDLQYYQRALARYQTAAETLTAESAPAEWATVKYHLAQTAQAIGEKGGGVSMLVEALENYRSALVFFTKLDYPLEWAFLQSRVGLMLYKTDPVTGDSENLKAAVAAFQSALQVITRASSPLKWSEVKCNLGQVLQVWGDSARSEELLERAIQCCQDALKIRNREESPLLWAATQNNMGSALFLLGRLTGESNPVERAADSFGKALSIYDSFGAARLAKVSERNLSRAEDVLLSKRERRVPKLDWEDEGKGERTARPKHHPQRKDRHIEAAE